MRGFVLDAGALVALDRRSTFMLDLLHATLDGAAAITIPRTVIAQVWRGGKQANTARLLKAAHAREAVVIDELTAERAKQIGVTIGRCSHPDIVDVHVALVAAERGDAVLTSDNGDITKIDPGLTIVHI